MSSPKPERTDRRRTNYDYETGEWRVRDLWRVPVIAESGELVRWSLEWREVKE